MFLFVFQKSVFYKIEPNAFNVSIYQTVTRSRTTHVFSTAHGFSVSQRLWQTPNHEILFSVLGNELLLFFMPRWSQVPISAQGCHIAAKFSMTEEDILKLRYYDSILRYPANNSNLSLGGSWCGFPRLYNNPSIAIAGKEFDMARKVDTACFLF